MLFTINLIYDEINIFKICKMISLSYKEKKIILLFFVILEAFVKPAR